MEKILASSWKNFIYLIITNCSKGYWYFSQFQYPLRKERQWRKIDQKIAEKYQTNISKDKKYRRKKKGLANYLLFRWENQAVLLKTEGQKLETDTEQWKKLEGKESIKIRVGDTEFEIRNINNKFSVKLTRATYRQIKAEIQEKLSKKDLNYAIKIFNNLNGLPNYAFLLKQKKDLRKFFIKETKRHLGNIKVKDRLVIKRVKLKQGYLFVRDGSLLSGVG